MGRLFWITSATVICAAGIGVKTLPDTGSEPRSVSYQATLPEQSPAATDGYEVGTSGSARQTAARLV